MTTTVIPAGRWTSARRLLELDDELPVRRRPLSVSSDPRRRSSAPTSDVRPATSSHSPHSTGLDVADRAVDMGYHHGEGNRRAQPALTSSTRNIDGHTFHRLEAVRPTPRGEIYLAIILNAAGLKARLSVEAERQLRSFLPIPAPQGWDGRVQVSIWLGDERILITPCYEGGITVSRTRYLHGGRAVASALRSGPGRVPLVVSPDGLLSASKV